MIGWIQREQWGNLIKAWSNSTIRTSAVTLMLLGSWWLFSSQTLIGNETVLLWLVIRVAPWGSEGSTIIAMAVVSWLFCNAHVYHHLKKFCKTKSMFLVMKWSPAWVPIIFTVTLRVWFRAAQKIVKILNGTGRGIGDGASRSAVSKLWSRTLMLHPSTSQQFLRPWYVNQQSFRPAAHRFTLTRLVMDSNGYHSVTVQYSF